MQLLIVCVPFLFYFRLNLNLNVDNLNNLKGDK